MKKGLTSKIMKTLYEFKANREKEIEQTETSLNEKNEEIKTVRKVKTFVPTRVALKKPSRLTFDEAELFYGVKLSEGIKAGLLTKALLAKRFNNDGGVLSEVEQLEYSQLYVDLFQLQTDFQKLSLKDKDIRSQEEQEKYQETIKRITYTRERIQNFEIAQAGLFDQTAENRARNKTIIWWMLHLSYIENEKGELESFFSEGDFLEKLKRYDFLEEEGDEFERSLIQKLIYLVSFWYMGRASSQGEFEKLLSMLESEPSKEDNKEEVKQESKKEIASES